MKTVFVEKKPLCNTEAINIYTQLKDQLNIVNLTGLRVLNRYDFPDPGAELYNRVCTTILSEPPVDYLYHGSFPLDPDETAFAVEYLKGQYDQRADSAAQCIQLITHGSKTEVKNARIYVLKGEISGKELAGIKRYLINPVDSAEGPLMAADIDSACEMPGPVPEVEGFTLLSESELNDYHRQMGFSMTPEDLEFCRSYFRDEEKREPTETELRVLDTYWSDHCRHTTFNTSLKEIVIEEGRFTEPLKRAYSDFLEFRKGIAKEKQLKDNICLMELATAGMKELRRSGHLNDLDVSEEINACSININVDIDGRNEDWLLMFKNETHNHPTEIEPFGGAATCLGGAIRDPLSGRSYVYQAMRLTGSGDPRVPIDETLPGKLPQRSITLGAASGYSSYGNQIGIATGHVHEVYHPGFIAKRMEVGAVIGAAPKENVKREEPRPGDVVVLVGGKTGRDGCGGATGSSKSHDEKSVETAGAEVQKGNPPEERKLQRLFRNPAAARLIKRSNDFGAGGVSVAVGELADGLVIDLDRVPVKYEGLSGTELAISESQERMAVVLSSGDEGVFRQLAESENLDAVRIAEVTEEKRLKMTWQGQTIVYLSRAFLDSAGVKTFQNIKVAAPDINDYFSGRENRYSRGSSDPVEFRKLWLENLSDLNVCSLGSLGERFDSTIGAGTVLLPYGGSSQLTPAESMAALIPVAEGQTSTASLMSQGYNPSLSSWSPFHGALYAVVESVARLAASGGDPGRIRLSLQEYFENPGTDDRKWGKPFAALLGALLAQKELLAPAIGGKDSMSGTFNDISVPPVVASFAVTWGDAGNIISPEFKKADNRIYLLYVPRDDSGLPDFRVLRANLKFLYRAIGNGSVVSAHSIRYGGMAEAISKMSFGNTIGADIKTERNMFGNMYGSVVIESNQELLPDSEEGEVVLEYLGMTSSENSIGVNGIQISLEDALKAWKTPLEDVFGKSERKGSGVSGSADLPLPEKGSARGNGILKPVNAVISGSTGPEVCIPVFPGTNCETDSAAPFREAGGVVETPVFRNNRPEDIDDSLAVLASSIRKSRILMIPGGFSAGDEPDGSGKFIASVFRNTVIADAVMELLNKRDGLILGICNGFQALLKLGLLPYGEIMPMEDDSPTLTFNDAGHHISRMVRTRVVSVISPWYSGVEQGQIHIVPVSHGEGKFTGSKDEIAGLYNSGQVSSQYVDSKGRPAVDFPDNPNGSMLAIEGITSADGRVMGKMAHSERTGLYTGRNISGNKNQSIFSSGILYFK